MRRKKIPSLQSMQTPLMLAFAFVFFLLAGARANAATPNPGHPWTEIGDGLFSIIGPTSLHQYSFPDATSTVLTTNAAVTAAQGGTGITSYAVGDLLYASGTNALSKLNAGSSGQVLTIAGGVPTWQSSTSSQWTTSSTAIFYNTGSVGIGINTPESPNLLHLYAPGGDTEMMLDSTASSGGTTMLTFRSLIFPSDTQNWNISINGLNDVNTGNIDFDDMTAGTTPFTIQRVTGNVGIGITAPTSLLYLNKTANDSTPAMYIYSTNADSEITIDGGASPGGGTAAVNLTSGTQTWRMSINGIDVGNNWNVEDATSGTVPLTVEKGTGNVGLGTMFPGEKLEVDGGIMLNTVTSKPACDVTHRGTQWFVQGGAGVQDTLEVCAKDAADAYDWRTIY